MQFVAFDMLTRSVEKTFPKLIMLFWRGLWLSDIEAAVRIKDKVFFFKGNEYIRYDVNANKVDQDFPKPTISLLKIWNKIDGAANIDNEGIIFFKSEQVLSLNYKTMLIDAGFPMTISKYVSIIKPKN